MTIPEILRTWRVVAVVGLSSAVWRPSFGVSEYMQKMGYTIIPVNPNETEVLGCKAWPSLDAVPEPIGIVNVFRRPEYLPEIVEASVRVGARVLWTQEGVVHAPAAEAARRAGLEVVMDRCILREHMALES
jgi:predicted CoA-binding protein